ncbi:tetratricopeptide repeat protein [Streptomyces sp. NBC_00249]|uniref:tetratricopeptide repeat protein n=1 Tax=Streptomyces sp. NBC_00249 TaxID=2975690 RepID=UPI00224F77A3|nr:tetratricopeptide repeat protein [Streptomyces sp. NBC_00249]MCX5199316.1 tetratricopeptide repeat protein [Streptomyces sp. NBC_00249]
MLQHLITQGEDLRMVPTDHDQLTTAMEKLREELLALPEGTDAARARVLARWTGIGLLSLGHHDEARTFLRRALDLAAASGNTRAVIATELNLADAYRYAGAAETADGLYRKALDAAQNQHPELADFALQHLGKHLMERGDVESARAHLWEARRLRIAKGDTGLIESTQAALDRVELLISQAGTSPDAPEGDGAEAAQWSRRWTSWLQSRTTARTPAGWEEGFPTLRDAVRDLTAHERVRPRYLRDQSFPVELLAGMAEEAEEALAGGGYLHNGKWNAPVGEAASRFAGQVDLAAVVARATGLEVEQPHTGVYIAYLEEGQFLDFHLDEFGFGEANLILCLKHDRLTASPTVSCTVFMNADGYLECDLAPGECVVFDGAITPHGRTPLGAGESVILVSFGFRARDQAPRTVNHLPPVPG